MFYGCPILQQKMEATGIEYNTKNDAHLSLDKGIVLVQVHAECSQLNHRTGLQFHIIYM
jgi:hypothetical protein